MTEAKPVGHSERQGQGSLAGVIRKAALTRRKVRIIYQQGWSCREERSRQREQNVQRHCDGTEGGSFKEW